jgi:hypothetical protein
MIAHFVQSVARGEAATRSLGLVRMGVPLLLWSRFGSDFGFFARPYGAMRFVLSALFFLTTSAMLVGLCARFASFGVGLVLTAHIGLAATGRASEAFLHHHVILLLIASYLLALSPCDRSLSWDRVRALARARKAGTPPPAERGPVYALYLFRAQLVVIYLLAAVDKTNAAFLSGERMQHYAYYFYFGSAEITHPLFARVCQALALGTVLLEYALAFFLLVPRAQRVLIPLGLAFHAALYLLVPVHTFSLTMALLYLTVLDPERVHQALGAAFSTVRG